MNTIILPIRTPTSRPPILLRILVKKKFSNSPNNILLIKDSSKKTAIKIMIEVTKLLNRVWTIWSIKLPLNDSGNSIFLGIYLSISGCKRICK